jgi:hypothetical protein
MPELHEANEGRVRALHVEIETATTMTSLVKYTREPELIRKYKEVAVRSYLSALDLVVGSVLLPKEENGVWDRLAPIREWLEREGILEKTEPHTSIALR